MPAACVLCFCLCLSACFVSVSFCFLLQKNMVTIVQRAEENLGGEKKTNEERNRRASIFLPINPLKINTFRFGAIATRREYVSLVVSLC